MRALAVAVLILAAACTPAFPGGPPSNATGQPSPSAPQPVPTASPAASPAGAVGQITEARSSVTRNPIHAATDEQLADVVAADRGLAVDLYHAIRAEEAGNLFISPYSISTALSMVLAGARGQTAQELDDALHARGSGDAWHVVRNRLELELVEQDRPAGLDGVPLTLEPTNAIFGQAGYPFKRDFLDTLAANYGAGMNALDFAGDPEVARIAINEWVAERTRERIEELLQQGVIRPTTRAVLVNAIYFKANWLFQFDPDSTDGQPFQPLDGTAVEVPMMHGEEKWEYAAGDGWQAVELPYHGQASMLVIVPEEGRFAEVEESVDAQFLELVESGLEVHVVDLRLPRWESESELDLIPPLRSLGVELLFDNADLSGIADANLFVSDAVHAANITVDEEGTEAAAATAVVVGESGAPPAELTVNRPFIYLIRDDATREILFMGRLLEP